MSAVILPARASWAGLVRDASAPYRRAGFFAWRFAHGKLRMDPVFRHVLSLGLIGPGARVLDIGCGQGLMASLLRACDRTADVSAWPTQWAKPPIATRVTGIELMPRDVERARAALGNAAEFICGDMRRTPFPESDVVVILDVLHYITVPEQDEVLKRVRQALKLGGTLLVRVGDASSRPRYLISQGVDALVTWVRGHRVLPQFGRTLAQWRARLEGLGFEVQSQPMSQGTPFANVLIVAKVVS